MLGLMDFGLLSLNRLEVAQNRLSTPLPKTSGVGFKADMHLQLSLHLQGMVIFVPEGNTEDHTRDPAYYDATYAFLRRCGIRELK